MGRYANWADVTGRYKDAATIVGAEGVGSYYLGAAEAETDGRLAPVYTVPFTPTPELVKDLVVDLTYYKMIVLRKDGALLKKYIDDRFAAVIAGTLTLTTSGTALAASATPSAWGTHTDYHAPFNAGDPITWQRSQAELDAAEAED
jgi:phage gp36-like protein